jgi:hypothetical protein
MLATKVFKLLASEVLARSTDIQKMTRTGYSFEEWLNWNLYLACSSKWWPSPRPSYRKKLAVTGSKGLADLLISSPEGTPRVVVEVAVIHDWVQAKWRLKVKNDQQKLRQVHGSSIEKLQIVILAADQYGPILGKDATDSWKTWREWLAEDLGAPTWGGKAFAKRSGEKGELAVFGWKV